MSPPSGQIESRTIRVNTPAKRGRKPYTTPDVIDVTGRTHFMVVRRLQTNKKPKKKINNNECKNCEQSDEYVDILEERVNKLEGLLNTLNDKVINVKAVQKNPIINSSELNSYSSLDISSLLRLSDTVGQVLYNNTQQVSPTTTVETEFNINENIMTELWDPKKKTTIFSLFSFI
ncbi:hypothetical protein RhiirA4_456091 [Rhizophagus irregularis]|uniref:Uncharacterized protein n=1 Tax=Rhizophagus irregularis TaxID=588596 RepID=A0A2I1G6U9_9GLOM|nr:hypothetical protein RhiirA4_456091 [Rhizophagus irregularis]